MEKLLIWMVLIDADSMWGGSKESTTSEGDPKRPAGATADEASILKGKISKVPFSLKNLTSNIPGAHSAT